MPTTTPMICIDSVSKLYNCGENEICALDGVSLTIDHGEFVAVVGASGSGKSTLMNMIGCLDTPTQGSYLLDGGDISSFEDNMLSHIRNRKIGFIFQGFNLIPSLTAAENVELPLIYRGLPKSERKALVIDALEKVSLLNRARHRPCEMSGGQQQRVAIARAIAASPPIILADEPTGNLDSQSGREVMQILQALHAEGKTVILITHDEEIAKLAKRTIRIHDGTIQSDISL